MDKYFDTSDKRFLPFSLTMRVLYMQRWKNGTTARVLVFVKQESPPRPPGTVR